MSESILNLAFVSHLLRFSDFSNFDMVTSVLPHLDLSDLKAIITAARAQQLSQDMTSTLYQKSTKMILRAMKAHVRLEDHNEFLRSLAKMVSSPLLAGLTINLCLCVSPSAEEEFSTLVDSVGTEMRYMEMMRRPARFNFRWVSSTYHDFDMPPISTVEELVYDDDVGVFPPPVEVSGEELCDSEFEIEWDLYDI